MFTPTPERFGDFMVRATGYHEAAECRRAVEWLYDCVERCMDEDVRSEAEPALAYLERNMAAKEFLPGQLRQALCNPDRVMREAGAHRVLQLIERNIPRHWIAKDW